MKYETYKKAQAIAHDAVICDEVIRFVDAYMPPKGSGYNFKIVLHNRELDCPSWMYGAIRDICEKKKDELRKQFEEL